MAEPSPSDESGNLTGILLITAGVGFLSTMDTIAKWLVTSEYSVFQIIAVRGWIIITLLVVWTAFRGGLGAVKTSRPGAHMLRVAIGFCAPYFFFTALGEMPQADTTVIFFGATTFLMTALSAVVLGERVGIHRWGAITIGFTGVLIAMQPGSGMFDTAAFYALGYGVSYAVLMVATRWLAPGEGTFKLVFYYNIGLASISSVFLFPDFKPMPVEDIGLIGLMAVLAVSGHICLTRAFAVASIGTLAPFEYSALVWAALLGFFFYNDIPGANVFAGAVIIIACGLYMVHRERLAARRRHAEAPGGEDVILLEDPMPVVLPAKVDTALDTDDA